MTLENVGHARAYCRMLCLAVELVRGGEEINVSFLLEDQDSYPSLLSKSLRHLSNPRYQLQSCKQYCVPRRQQLRQ